MLGSDEPVMPIHNELGIAGRHKERIENTVLLDVRYQPLELGIGHAGDDSHARVGAQVFNSCLTHRLSSI